MNEILNPTLMMRSIAGYVILAGNVSMRSFLRQTKKASQERL